MTQSYASGDYNPHGKTAEILDRAYDLVQSVPYAVSARWLFYRLLQEGYYSRKDDYKNKFLKAVSAARHAFYKDWRPDTLEDETREAITRGRGSADVTDWLDLVATGLFCRLDKWNAQPYYVELWYEARAMTQQFAHYTQHVTLRPMGGQPSIKYKWDTAKALEEAAAEYSKPVVILYFGDLDNAGEAIADVAERDVRKWCNADFAFVHCGLNADQVKRYSVPENPEKPGQYQWEALPDNAAREIIGTATAEYLRHDAFDEVAAREERATRWMQNQVRSIAEQWNGGAG